MFSTKKDIDRHVKTSLNKLPENERYLRGLAIARQYFKLNEYASAEHWLSCYLSVQEDSAPAHKLLGQCYEKQKKFDRAITSYQRSLQLDSKQTGLITDVCKLLLMDDNLTKHLSKAKHWCDLAESERINHEAVLNLKLKVANKDAGADSKLVKDIILKEVLARPLDPLLRVRLVDHLLEEKKLDEAFKYCFELEMKFCEPFMQSSEWTNGVANMLAKFAEAPVEGGKQKHWNYYLLQALVLDRQIYLNLLADSTMETIKRSNLKEIAQKLFKLDQTLLQVAEKGRNAAPQKQMADAYLRHYRGQLLLYSAALLFKAAQDQTGGAGEGGGRARDTSKKCLALLLMAYQCGVPDPDEPWLKQSSEMARHLVGFWSKQAAFRCCQAGSTLVSCVEDGPDVSVLAQIQSVTESKVWTTADDLVNQIRQLCSDPGWRQSVARALYTSGDLSSKATSSGYFVKDGVAFGEPQYVLPKREQLELYVELAQSLYPSSLPYLVYLGLVVGTENLSDFHCKAFPRLNFSTNNLNNSNLETLNQLDMDSFLYCCILIAQSNLDGNRQLSQQQGRPAFLPAANLMPLLCEDNKIDWWSVAYNLIKSSTAKEAAASVAEQRQLLEHGIQAIRGTDAPLCDVMVLLKLGQVLAKRAAASTLTKAEERRYVETRAEAVYRAGVLLWKMRAESSYGGGMDGGASTGYGSGLFFKYAAKSYDCQQELAKLAESAITFLAGVYFKHGRYEEFTQDFGGIPLPFAAYFRAEAFKKLDEQNKTPLKSKKFYSERARECIRQTQRYLELPYVERNHPLNYVVQSEIKRLSFTNDSLDGSLNTSANGAIGASADDSDHFQSFTSSMTNPGMTSGGGGGGGMSAALSRSISERDAASAAATAAASLCLSKTNDLEALMRQMMETLTFVKEDVLGIRNDVGDMQDRLVKIEENIYRKPTEAKGGAPNATATSTPMGVNDSASVSAAAAAAAVQAMNDMYMMDELQSSASALAYQHAAAAAAAAARAPVMGGVGMGTPQQPASALPYHTLYGANAYQSYMPGQIQQHQQQQQQQHQQQQMLTPRGHAMTGAMGASPMHSAAYQHHPDNLLVAAGSSPAAGGGYHMPGFQQAVPPPPVAPQPEPQVAPVMHSTPTAVSQMVAPAPKTAASANLSIEQSLQTPALLSSWNSTYNNSFMAQTSTPSVSNILPAHITSSVELKGGAPVNVVITSSDPLPPPPSVNSSTFAAGAAVQPTYSVTIPPQHIKHSNTGASIAQGTTGNSNAPKLEMVSPAANTKFPMPSIVSTGGLTNSKPAAAAPAPATAPAAALTPSFFANMVSPAKMAAEANQADEEEDDDDKNVSGSAEYDPRPDFQPIIPLPDEIVVRTGEEDEEQIFTGRSKLLRLVDREWKERGLGELKILRSKADRSKYRIVMRREQVHKICANHYITPELIIKPMEKRKECYIWAAMDFADEEPRKESFCARFGTAALANEFYAAFVAARDEVARLRAASGDQQSSAAPPPATMGSFAYSSTPKSSAASSTPAAAAPVQSQATAKPFGEFSFAKNYTPPAVVGTKASAKGPDSTPTSSTVQGGSDAKPSPFASFTFKAQTPGGSASSPFGNIFGGAGVVAGAPSLGFEERDFSCAHETNVVGLKRKEQQAGMWIDCAVSNGQLRLLTSQSAVRLLMRNGANTTVHLNHVLSKEVQIKASDKTACSWTVQQDAAYPAVTGPISFMAQFKTADERDRFVAAVQKAFPGSTSGPAAVAGGGAKTASGFGDLFKPKTGSWDCPGCYVNNKADSAQCVACNGPRDPSKKEEQKPSLSGGLFGNLAPPTEAASKFTFGMPSSSVTVTPITFGSAANTKKPLQEQPAKAAPVTSTPVAKGVSTGGGGGGFGDQFKPKPGSWTCNGCYLSNGADALYCMSCESPKDDTVPKKSAGGAAGGLLKGATDTAPKISFAAGGGFTFGLPSSTTITPVTSPAMATGTATTTISATSLPPQQQQPVFGGGFSFGNPMKPPQSASSTVATAGTTAAAAATTTTTLDKPAFKFELPTPSGGLSFGSKLTPNAPAAAKAAGDGPAVVASTPSSSAISKLEPPEKATFGFVFKPKSPGRTLSGDGDGAEDDGAAGDNSVTEEENNTYFAPVIPLPDKIDVKTGEEDEHVLYAHRAKLYRFVSSEWKERGIGDVKILKHKVTGKLRVVMRREQVLKICLNHALTEDICYTKKDDKSWQFVANDFSEGNFEIMNFCLRFKSSDIAQEFRDAITDALSGKLSAPVEAKDDGAPSTKVTSPAQNDITITSTSSPVGDLNFSKLSDISLNERETAQKLKLPDNFFDPAATPCAGCRGCDSDAFVFPAVDGKQLAVVEADDAPLPIDIRSVKPLPAAVASSSPKKVTFGTISAGTMQPPAQLFGGGGVASKPFAASEPATGAGMFAGVAFKAPASSTTASGTTGSFLSAEQKASSSPFAASIFGGAQQPPSSTTVTDPAAASAGSNKFAFGSSTPLGSAATGGSIFSASLNTTPKTSFVSPAPTSTVTAVGTGAQVTSTTDSKKDGASTVTTGSSPLLQPASLTTPPSAKSAESGGKLFSGFGGGAGFGSAGSTTNIFGGGNIFGSNATNSIAAATTASNSSNSTTSTPTATAGGAANNTSTLFGSVAFGDPGKPSVFGGSGFTFGSLAKQSPAGGGANSSISTALKNNSDAPSIFKMDDSVSFATLASSNSPAFSSSTKQADDGTAKPAGGFVGLTVKEDFFSRSASAKLNSSTDGTNSSQTNNNGNADDGAGGEDGGGAAGGGDENYDPYYAPVIQLPDEIEVRTGEEEETKLFGERAKLYRFDATTKEWKERGVGELKILHHPVRNTYRLLLRREQIFKLVLNHAVTADLSIAPMNNSDKAFAWGAMNHAESPGQLEQLAVRFKNEAIASEFRSTLERCQEQLRSRPDLEPDQD
uniref:E3 SUMO-protein ligase RanBP2 n=1 Tax=Anopheles coluzzii TaxID=1518534 RepID=A0A6E8V5U8_ANOCL|nr:E3 SUMO-protein ligase RanBP2 [Anopheles coluzzii]